MSFLINLFFSFIIFYCLYIIFKIIIILYKKFIRKPLNLTERYGEGSYALITGATEGIGKEFCIQLAKLKFNLILVSRNIEKLKKVSDELKNKFINLQTILIEFDFSKKFSIKEYEKFFLNNKEIKNLDISILINNIGISQRELFINYSLEFIMDTININIVSQSLLTKIFINKLLNRNKKSAIISMSSYSATLPLILSSIYCASKIYDDYLIRAIAEENKGKNIDFLSVRPQYVNTPSRAEHKKEFKAISTEECVTGIFQDLGYETVTNGYWSHCIKGVIFDIFGMKIKNFFRYIGNKEKFKNKNI
jgi:17beta-estradiol 17-dehydrogenase / very-long-chain 3-oxoacyl-CoA reductase